MHLNPFLIDGNVVDNVFNVWGVDRKDLNNKQVLNEKLKIEDKENKYEIRIKPRFKESDDNDGKVKLPILQLTKIMRENNDQTEENFFSSSPFPFDNDVFHSLTRNISFSHKSLPIGINLFKNENYSKELKEIVWEMMTAV
jgi:hypothetical protein